VAKAQTTTQAVAGSWASLPWGRMCLPSAALFTLYVVAFHLMDVSFERISGCRDRPGPMKLRRPTMPEVAKLFLCFVHRFPMKEVEEAQALQNKGLKGCIHGRPNSKRQVSLMDLETLQKLGIPPGAVKENVTTRGLDFQSLQPGHRLRVGD